MIDHPWTDVSSLTVHELVRQAVREREGRAVDRAGRQVVFDADAVGVAGFFRIPVTEQDPHGDRTDLGEVFAGGARGMDGGDLVRST
ncbi:hypothetical protein [Streptomyces sp. cmx-4-7]|uniref:hypothetical protein n=1 Tax=Streptomyces sp. cmx-4-7 TaxID=2790939 RepID=UPI0039816115